MHFLSLLLAVVFLLFFQEVDTLSGRGVCQRSEPYDTRDQTTVHSSQAVYTKTNCGFWGWSKCSKITYRLVNRQMTVYRREYRQISECCSGWTQAKGKCVINGGWSSFGPWSTCSVSCGEGTASRQRHCSNPSPQNGGRNCVGSAEEKKNCTERPCPVDGTWMEWSTWSNCSESCGSGESYRFRECEGLRHGGRECAGQAEDQRMCNVQPCPVSKVTGTGSNSTVLIIVPENTMWKSVAIVCVAILSFVVIVVTLKWAFKSKRSDEREFASKQSESQKKKTVPLTKGEKHLVDTFVSLEFSNV